MKTFYILLFVLLQVPAFAQKEVTVSGSYTYYAESSQTPKEAKQRALEGARLQAIAQEFGTVITQSTHQAEYAVGGDEHSYFSQLSDTEVKGEWIEDVGEPKYEISFVQDMLVVRCEIVGKARPLSNEATDFEARLLRNGTEPKFADVHFRHGDDMFLQFCAPVDGYVAVYLIDEVPNAYCLLPYRNNEMGQQAVKRNTHYLFFSQANASRGEVVDEYTLTCQQEEEHNTLYVIFSPKPFVKAIDTQVDEGMPRELSYEAFNRWLTTCRKRDPKMGVQVMHLEIKK
jgi:hypothetical protein